MGLHFYPSNPPAEMYKLLTAALLVLLVPQALAIPSPQGGNGTVDTPCTLRILSTSFYTYEYWGYF